MRTIYDGDEWREINSQDLIREFEDDVMHLDRGDIDEAEWQLITNQYAYVKLGLILEKIRNQCWWQKCSEKFASFRAFCQVKVNLNIWQVTNAIKSAQVALKLAWLGFTELPRNASQALKLAELSPERLSEVWGNVIGKYQGHKITALAIEKEIDPDKQPTKSTIKISKALLEQLQKEAIDSQIPLEQLIEEMLSQRFAADNSVEPTETAIELNDEQLAIIEACAPQGGRVEHRSLKPAAPKKMMEATLDSFDRLMENLVGQFIPPIGRVANE